MLIFEEGAYWGGALKREGRLSRKSYFLEGFSSERGDFREWALIRSFTVLYDQKTDARQRLVLFAIAQISLWSKRSLIIKLD